MAQPHRWQFDGRGWDLAGAGLKARLLRFLVHALFTASWPVLYSALGFACGYFLEGHPHAWQVIPLLGALLGGALTLLDAAVLLGLWLERGAAQHGVPVDAPRSAV